MKELKEDIIEAVQYATDTVDGTVSIPILDHFLDGILTEQCNIAYFRLSLLNKVKEIAFVWVDGYKMNIEAEDVIYPQVK